jgi:SSS family solute:Na+ symporter
MGLAFLFTALVMIGISLTGPRINPKAFQLDKTMFKVSPTTVTLIVITVAILMAIYVKFW